LEYRLAGRTPAVLLGCPELEARDLESPDASWFILEDLEKTAWMIVMAAKMRYAITTRHQRPNVRR
jgi:hypothetical protein